jgi:hypothetical protein
MLSWFVGEDQPLAPLTGRGACPVREDEEPPANFPGQTRQSITARMVPKRRNQAAGWHLHGKGNACGAFRMQALSLSLIVALLQAGRHVKLAGLASFNRTASQRRAW